MPTMVLTRFYGDWLHVENDFSMAFITSTMEDDNRSGFMAI